MVVTRSSTSKSIKQSAFMLTWSGTSRGQGQYEFEYMLKKRWPVYSHVKNKQYVIWRDKTEWRFGKRSELNKRDPGMFAWCADQCKTPLAIRTNWKILDSANVQWVDCQEFSITPVSVSKEDSSDAEKDYFSYKMSPDEEAQVQKKFEPLKRDVNRNSHEIKNLKSKTGDIMNPKHKSDLAPLERRLYKLEKEELEKASKLAQRVEKAYSTVQEICKRSKNSLKKEELRVLNEWDLLKYTTMKKLKHFLREKRNDDYYIRNYGYIKLSGKKVTIAKRVKRILDKMEKDGESIKSSSEEATNTIENKEKELEMSPKRKRRKISSRCRS